MRRQDGSAGWSAAQDKREMDGWAGLISGARAAREAGSEAAGKRMGEVKAGQRRREICASPSTKASVDGQGVVAVRDDRG